MSQTTWTATSINRDAEYYEKWHVRYCYHDRRVWEITATIGTQAVDIAVHILHTKCGRVYSTFDIFARESWVKMCFPEAMGSGNDSRKLEQIQQIRDLAIGSPCANVQPSEAYSHTEQNYALQNIGNLDTPNAIKLAIYRLLTISHSIIINL